MCHPKQLHGTSRQRLKVEAVDTKGPSLARPLLWNHSPMTRQLVFQIFAREWQIGRVLHSATFCATTLHAVVAHVPTTTGISSTLVSGEFWARHQCSEVKYM